MTRESTTSAEARSRLIPHGDYVLPDIFVDNDWAHRLLLEEEEIGVHTGTAKATVGDVIALLLNHPDVAESVKRGMGWK